MGGASNKALRYYFGLTPMPVTLEQLEKNNPGEPVYQNIETLTESVIKDGEGYWLSDAVMAEGITKVEAEIARLQKYIDHWQSQRQALAASQLAKK